MKIYIIIGAVLILFSFLEIFFEKFRRKEGKKVFYILLFIVGTIFMSRWFVGWDWYSYYPYFQGKSQNFEKGYIFLTELTRRFTDEYQLFVALNTLIDFLFLLWVIPRYSNYPITTLMLYLGVNGLPLEVDIMRNVKSIMLFLLSIEFIQKKKILFFVGMNLLGAFFHVSSLLYIPLYFLLPVSYKKRIILGIFMLGNIYYFSGLNLIGEALQYIPSQRLSGYLNFSQKGGGDLNIFYLERLLIFLFAFFTGEMVERKKRENYCIFQNSIYLSVYIFLYLKEFPVIALRFFLLFSFSYWYIFPVFLDSLEKRIREKISLRMGVFILVGGITFFRTYNFLTFPGNRVVYPYENYFFEKTSRENKIRALKEGIKYREEGKKREILLLY
ncbi:MAG: EpsG family protein [Fusobacteriaceae bacterium]